LKVFKYIKKKLLDSDFRIIESGWEWNKKAILWYILPQKELSKYRLHIGPKLCFKEHVTEFKKKNEKYSFLSKNGRIYAKIPRKHRKVSIFIKWLINNDKSLGKYIKKLEIAK
jgi:tRNA nucleotidyltransferase (CCA-adding enzyme)